MRLITCMHTQSRCYGAKRKSAKPIGIVVHSTGANNPYIKRYSQPSDKDEKRGELLALLGVNTYGNHWNTPSASKAVHYVIGKLADGSVATVQNLPEDIACWGAGSGKKGSYNYDPVAHIQFEICEDDLSNADYFRATAYGEAIELCADICYRHGWDANVIVSHREAHAKGYASNHADINHWLEWYGKSMNSFRQRVQDLLDEMRKPKTITLYSVTVDGLTEDEANALEDELVSRGLEPEITSYEEECVEVQIEEETPKFVPYNVQVNTPSGVKIRAGAGTDHSQVGTIKNKTTVSIAGESLGKGANLWGKLADGRGWIALDYTVRKD